MREVIIAEIKRIAEANGGKPPGVAAFTKLTGIPQHKWYGVIWPRWGDAVRDAGFPGNVLRQRFDGSAVLRKVVEAFREQGSIPTTPEMKILRRRDPSFPNPKTVVSHCGSRAELVEAVRAFCQDNAEFADLLPLVPAPLDSVGSTAAATQNKPTEGWVYLIRAGEFHKIGRSDQIERRVKEIRIALPEAATLIHAIKTDDPPGIESYWHRRFADRRANGEWFKLSAADVAAFSRRKFQ